MQTSIGVFRECGGARCSHNMVPLSVCRNQALAIVQQLILCSGGDDDMGTVLGLMHTASAQAVPLKIHILKVKILCQQTAKRCCLVS
jgi:WD repeat and FYVE domain-containing protein 3